MRDKVTFTGEISTEGEKESATFRKVNIRLDVSGRTLLAWYRLKMMRYCMPGDTMLLYVIFRQECEALVRAMTSIERREARYERRVQKRRQKRQNRIKTADDFDAVFSYENLYRAYEDCRRGVAWKSSVQKFIATAPLSVHQTLKRLKNGSYKSQSFFEFDLSERGKTRHIRSIVIGDRIVQKCLCDNSLTPMLTTTFVYDNGASIKNKGYDFCINRLTAHLQQYYRKHGSDGYILLFDFSKFFDNISHEVIKGALAKIYTDERLKKLIYECIDAFGSTGLGLGSQVSQVLALASANRLDHYVKEVLQIKGYGRYMDDGYLIHQSKEHLQKCLAAIKTVCEELGITLNAKKTQLVKLSHGFVWLKARIYLTEDGKVVRKIYKRSITSMRRKLKSMRRFVDEKKMSYQDVYNSWQSWKAHAEKFSAWNTIQSMAKLYNELFVFGGQYVH